MVRIGRPQIGGAALAIGPEWPQVVREAVPTWLQNERPAADNVPTSRTRKARAPTSPSKGGDETPRVKQEIQAIGDRANQNVGTGKRLNREPLRTEDRDTNGRLPEHGSIVQPIANRYDSRPTKLANERGLLLGLGLEWLQTKRWHPQVTSDHLETAVRIRADQMHLQDVADLLQAIRDGRDQDSVARQGSIDIQNQVLQSDVASPWD